MKKEEWNNYALLVFGTFLFCLGVNFFVVPLDLYNGGIIGIAQIIRTLLMESLPFSIPSGFDIAGILNFVINLPLLFLAYRSISKSFFVKTLLSVGLQTLFLSIIPVLKQPIIDDVLASCLIAGLLCGFGIGVCLRSGGSGGGLDILGVYYTKNFSGSVGKLSLIVNAFVFGVCAWLFQIETAIFSILYMVFMTMVMDRVHYQNINVTMMIFTKNEKVKKVIMETTGRGVTYWEGAGAYTDEKTNILMTAVNKYEAPQIKKLIMDMDPQAFIIFNEGLHISGNFEKRI